MEKTFIMSVKKKYEVHVTTDLNCEETYAPEGDNTIDLEKNLENIISFFIFSIYLIYNFLYTNFHSIIIFIWVGKICKKIDAICLKTFPAIKILLYIFLGIGMLYGLISGKQEIRMAAQKSQRLSKTTCYMQLLFMGSSVIPLFCQVHSN